MIPQTSNPIHAFPLKRAALLAQMGHSPICVSGPPPSSAPPPADNRFAPAEDEPGVYLPCQHWVLLLFLASGRDGGQGEEETSKRGPGRGGRRWQAGAGECGTACREWDALKNDVENKKK